MCCKINSGGIAKGVARWLGIVAVVVSGTAHGQIPATNLLGFRWVPVVSNSVVENARTNAAIEPCPLIEFEDVPITTAIDNLARQGEMNYLIDPEIDREWRSPNGAGKAEPLLTLHWKNIAPKDALKNILSDHDLKLVESPVTHVALVMKTGQSVETVDASLLGMETNIYRKNISDTNGVIPLIQYSDYPMGVALEDLFYKAGLSCVVDPRILESRHLELNLHWTGVTAKQAILAICEAYNLVLIPDEESEAIRIQPGPIKRHHHLRLR
jgi:hypothetical protein